MITDFTRAQLATNIAGAIAAGEVARVSIAQLVECLGLTERTTWRKVWAQVSAFAAEHGWGAEDQPALDAVVFTLVAKPV